MIPGYDLLASFLVCAENEAEQEGVGAAPWARAVLGHALSWEGFGALEDPTVGWGEWLGVQSPDPPPMSRACCDLIEVGFSNPPGKG